MNLLEALSAKKLQYINMKNLFSLLILLIFCCGCNRNGSRIYENKELLRALCKDKLLLKTRGEYYFFKTFKKDEVNSYFIDASSGRYILMRDSIQYAPDIDNWAFPRGTQAYKNEIGKYVKDLKEKLDAFGIVSFQTNGAALGEPLKFYMEDGRNIVNIPNLDRLPDYLEEYKGNLKKIEGDWYYTD
jgi:hypothetical protein